MKLTIKGVQGYWFHDVLVSLLQRKTGWDEQRTKVFIARNELVHFTNTSQAEARQILDELEAGGFEIRLEQVKGDVVASVAIPYGKELDSLKRELSNISSRLERLEKLQGIKLPADSIKESPIYQQLSRQAEVSPKPSAPQVQTPVSSEEAIPRATAESNIGKYWLSRIGIFTLILGVVLFISHSFQFIGPWGKTLTGVGIGALLIGLGNYLSSREAYRKWAMATIGGGWAICYFTVYAAYHIPAAKVITNPLTAFGCLLVVVMGSISQSLKFKSPTLVFFSYFLGYVAITMVEISFYTLVASFLLAVSIVIVTKKMGWSWLALLGLAAVYLTHYAWVEPTIYGAGGGSFWTDALVLPWAGEEWRIYPLIAPHRSALHQCFLILYWLLFTVLGFLKNEKTGKNPVIEENLNLVLLLANSFIFTASYVHHLHVYYPELKYIFPLAMGTVFLLLFWAEQKLSRRLLADAYLAFSVTLFCLAVPMYFDGPWITYGWSAAAVILAWLGIRHDRKVLRISSWVLAGVVALRLLNFDYLESQVLFRFVMPVRSSLPIFMAAGAAYLAMSKIYSRSRLVSEKERRISENICLIAASLSLGFGFLFGGFRTATSVLWVLEGAALMFFGVQDKRFSLRIMSALFMLFGAFRLASVDYALELLKMLSEPKVALRLATAGASIFIVLFVGDWLRRKVKTIAASDLFLSHAMTVAGAILVLCYFYDKGISSWVSIVWGASAFAFIVCGFALNDKWYRWSGLGMFTLVLLRLFFHDFSTLETIYRIISFIGLGIVFIAASFIYSYYSKVLLGPGKESTGS